MISSVGWKNGFWTRINADIIVIEVIHYWFALSIRAIRCGLDSSTCLRIFVICFLFASSVNEFHPFPDTIRDTGRGITRRTGSREHRLGGWAGGMVGQKT